MRYRQHASGEFAADVVPGTNHCGRDERRGVFRYCVDIEYTCDAALDDRGFLLDNLEFASYFEGLPAVTLSCEQLAATACAHFRSRLAERIQFVKALTCKVYPFGDVYVEAEEDETHV